MSFGLDLFLFRIARPAFRRPVPFGSWLACGRTIRAAAMFCSALNTRGVFFLWNKGQGRCADVYGKAAFRVQARFSIAK